MAEEAADLLRSLQVEPSTNLIVSIDPATVAPKLARLNTVLLDAEAGSSMIASRSDVSARLPSVLVSMINSPTLLPKARFTALQIIASLSRTPDTWYRREVLLPAVTSLDASFEGLLLDREDATLQFGVALGKPHEHLLVILFRVTEYSGLHAADLLEQLCDKDDVMLANLLLNMVRVRSYEWPLVLAAVRCLYELSLPNTYFSPESVSASGNEAIQVSAFQSKIAALVIHFMQGNTLKQFGDELAERWGLCTKQAPDLISQSIPHFAAMLKYFSGLLLNLEDFCDQAALQRTYQQSLLVQLSSTMTDLIASFVVSSLNYSSALLPATGPDSGIVCSGILGCLKVLRLACYKPSIGLTPSLVTCLRQLVDTAIARLPVMRQPVLIPALLYLLEVLVNVDAANHADLGLKLQDLISTIAADDTRVVGNATLSQTLSTLFLNEASVFVVMENATTGAITSGLCGAALDTLVDEIMQYIDRELSFLGVGPAIFEFFIPDGSEQQDLVFVPMPREPEAITASSGAATVTDGESNAHASPSLGLPPYAPTSPPLDNSSMPVPAKKHRHQKHRGGHPKEYVSMLSGKLMREPVVLRKTGNRYDLEELERVIADVGHVDPITGESYDEDPEVDLKLQQEIQQYKVLRSSKRRHGSEP